MRKEEINKWLDAQPPGKTIAEITDADIDQLFKALWPGAPNVTGHYETREQLVDAIVTMHREGPKSTGRSIAKATGVSKALVHNILKKEQNAKA